MMRWREKFSVKRKLQARFRLQRINELQINLKVREEIFPLPYNFIFCLPFKLTSL